MGTSTRRPQRTGWVILMLMVVSNFMAWMEPLIGETTRLALLADTRLRASFGACLIASTLVTATWLAGRYSTTRLPRIFQSARLLGFRLALAAAGTNIVAGFIVASFASEPSLAGWRLGIGVVWFLLILPAEILSSYLTGRGSAPRTALSY